MDPAGKTAVVTGGNSGLGEATVRALLAAGAHVVSFDLAGEAPDGARFIPCDVSDQASVVSAVASIDGPIHILINCAGRTKRSPTLQVLGPQGWLSGTICMPHTVCEQRSPGAVQVPQLGLQQT